jgi:DNA (cytosine-5)-methyltransferase 1
VQLFLLNAASMGVPQKRERVFFICQRNDLNFPKLELKFNETAITFKEIENGTIGKPITGEMLKYWNICPEGFSLSKVHPKGNYFGSYKIGLNNISNTIIASNSSPVLHNKKPNYLSDNNICQIGTYPLDYNFKKIEPKYLIGMSVPPVMTAQIATEIKLQWFDKIKTAI